MNELKSIRVVLTMSDGTEHVTETQPDAQELTCSMRHDWPVEIIRGSLGPALDPRPTENTLTLTASWFASRRSMSERWTAPREGGDGGTESADAAREGE